MPGTRFSCFPLAWGVLSLCILSFYAGFQVQQSYGAAGTSSTVLPTTWGIWGKNRAFAFPSLVLPDLPSFPQSKLYYVYKSLCPSRINNIFSSHTQKTSSLFFSVLPFLCLGAEASAASFFAFEPCPSSFPGICAASGLP